VQLFVDRVDSDRLSKPCRPLNTIDKVVSAT
jgi:hypothetical protein